jgi:cytochrome c
MQSMMKRLAAMACALAASPAWAGPASTGDVQAGLGLFQKTCANCHSIEAGVNKVGPSLFDVVNRPIASVQGYEYSPKMRQVAKDWKVWDEGHLDRYLTNPRQVLHGVRMFFAVPDPKDRANVIAYLSTLK